MHENNMAMPTQADLTGEVGRILNPEMEDSLFFCLKMADIQFTMGLSDILLCLKYAEEQGEVPELPREWWCEVSAVYPKILELFP